MGKMEYAGSSGTHWTDREKGILAEIVRNATDAEKATDELAEATGIDRSGSAVYNMLQELVKSNGDVHPDLMKSFGVWKAKHDKIGLRETRSVPEWISCDRAAKMLGRSESWVRQRVRVGMIRTQDSKDGQQFSSEDVQTIIRGREEVVSREDLELDARVKAAIAHHTQTGKAISVKLPSGVKIKAKPWSAVTVAELVTPERASEFLRSSLGNRPVSVSAVRRYAKEMEENWRENSTAVSIDWHGHAVNGHHRMYAVIATGKPVMMYVMYGIAPESYLSEDVGRVRSPWQSLSDPFRKEISAWANVLRLNIASGYNTPMRLDELMRYADRNRDAIAWAKGIAGKRSIASPAYIFGALVAAYHINPVKVDQFARMLVDQVDLQRGMPAHTLVRYLTISDRNAAMKMRPDKKKLITRKTLRAVLAYIDGSKITEGHLYEISVEDQKRVIDAQPEGVLG